MADLKATLNRELRAMSSLEEDLNQSQVPSLFKDKTKESAKRQGKKTVTRCRFDVGLESRALLNKNPPKSCDHPVLPMADTLVGIIAQNFLKRSSKYQTNQTNKIFGSILIITLVFSGYFLLRQIQLNTATRLIEGCSRKKICQGRIGALSQLVLAQRSLQSYQLVNAHLTGAKLTGANLTGANLTSAYLLRANLNGANLTGAYLTDASLGGAYLTDANLSGAYLTGANLGGAYLTGANLDGADLTNTNLDHANLHGANLDHANLTGAYLTGANLIKANNITPSQIKSACYWDKAVYKGQFDPQQSKWIVDYWNNQHFIAKLKQDIDSNPKQTFDCIRWEGKVRFSRGKNNSHSTVQVSSP